MPKSLTPAIGDRFGEWKIVGERFTVISKAGYKTYLIPVVCSCGFSCDTRFHSLISGKSTRCPECRIEKRRTHRMSKSPEYKIWKAMLQRCYDKNSNAYFYYGGRGVIVCDRWNPDRGGSFDNFYKDIGPRPSSNYQLDKEAVFLDNKIYGPGLVKWSPRSENITRRRNTNYVSIDGERIPIFVLAKKYGVCYFALRLRTKNKHLTAAKFASIVQDLTVQQAS
jgi:hypothetical protein